MNAANYLTMMRVFVGPLFLYLYLEHAALGISQALLPYCLLALITFSELTDLFDGMIARKYRIVTDFGKILDPMADSIMRISVFMTFTIEPVGLPMILVFFLFYRDSIVSTLRTVCALKGGGIGCKAKRQSKSYCPSRCRLYSPLDTDSLLCRLYFTGNPS